MPQKLYRDLCEAAGQVRGLLENLQQLGVQELPWPMAVEPPQVCPSGPVPAVAALVPGICRPETLEEIRADLGDCHRCTLSKGREKLVFGCGNEKARVVFVGEAPGREEDKQGLPFVGEAGRLLDRMLFAMGLCRDDAYLCNLLKCQPPGNRDPKTNEIALCQPFLGRQLVAIRPRVIVTLGRFAAQALLSNEDDFNQVRGCWHTYGGMAVMPTYHPAYLLRNPALKREAWEDLKLVMSRLRDSDA